MKERVLKTAEELRAANRRRQREYQARVRARREREKRERETLGARTVVVEDHEVEVEL
jgi:hypothetical protein